MYIEDRNFLTKEHKDYINNVVLQDAFPFYWNDRQTIEDNLPFLSHTLYNRPEAIEKGLPAINSPHYEIFFDMLQCFLKKNKIKFNKILRASVNLTFNINKKKSKIHVDHEFEHNQVIIYLNESDGETMILNDNKKTVFKKIKPEKFKGICFNKKPHYIIFPKKNRRLIAVYTFI